MMNLALVVGGTVYITMYPFPWLSDLLEVKLANFISTLVSEPQQRVSTQASKRLNISLRERPV